MVRKKFDRALYNEYDINARRHFKNYIEHKNLGIVWKDDPFGSYGIDLACRFPNGDIILIDLEVRPLWKTGEFPFSTIHLPERKRKYFTYGYPTFFVAFRDDYKAFIVIDKDDIDTDNVISLTNKYSKDEKFFDIDIERCRFVRTKI